MKLSHIKRNAPKGATHYSVYSGLYYKVDDKIYHWGGDNWDYICTSNIKTPDTWVSLREPPFLKTLFEIGCYLLGLAIILYFCRTFGWV